jgi:hypothetical protein
LFGKRGIHRHLEPALLAFPDQAFHLEPLPDGRWGDVEPVALVSSLLEPGQGPAGKRQPQALGLGAGQRDHGPSHGFIMLARTARARRVG